MKKEDTAFASPRDQHLDALLRIALEQMEKEETARLSQSPDPALNAEEALGADRLFQAAWAAESREKKRRQGSQRKQKALRIARRAAAALAIMAVLALIALPVAMAASPAFRTMLMNMLVEIDQDRGRARVLIRTGEEARDFPDGSPERMPASWQGSYFPQYLPEGFTLSDHDKASSTAVFTSPAGQTVTFSEGPGPVPPKEIPADAFCILENINGFDCPVYEERRDGGVRITVIWEEKEVWYSLVTENLEREETLRIADSVTCISLSGTAEAASPAKREPTLPTSAPDWWAGRYYPSLLPGDLTLESFSVSGQWARYLGAGERRFYFSEFNSDMSYTILSADMDAQTVSINGKEGRLLTIGGAGSEIILFYLEDEAGIQLDAWGLSMEEVLTIAGSITKLDRPAPSGSLSGIPLPPREWKGEYFPAFLPQELLLDAAAQSSLVFRSRDGGQSLEMGEYHFSGSSLPNLREADAAELIRINGAPGILLHFTELPSQNVFRLYWQTPGDVTLELVSRAMPRDTVLRIAESMEKNASCLHPVQEKDGRQ